MDDQKRAELEAGALQMERAGNPERAAELRAAARRAEETKPEAAPKQRRARKTDET